MRVTNSRYVVIDRLDESVRAVVDAVTVMLPLVPVIGPGLVAVTVYMVPTVVPTVKLTVAIPLAFVVLVAAEKLPPVPVFDQVTTTPEVGTATFVASASWAVMVTTVPGVGVELLDVTIHLLASRKVTVLSVLVEATVGWLPVTPRPAPAGMVAMTVPLLVMPDTAAL